MGKGIAILRKCSVYVPASVMIDVVLSHLEYCPVSLSSAAEKHLKNKPSKGIEQERQISSPLFFSHLCLRRSYIGGAKLTSKLRSGLLFIERCAAGLT